MSENALSTDAPSIETSEEEKPLIQPDSSKEADEKKTKDASKNVKHKKQAKFGRPTRESIKTFLTSGIEMMKSDETRSVLSNPSLDRPGQHLIELQRAGWDPLGFDRDLGCNTLDQAEKDYPDDKELHALKMEFIHTASRTFLKSLVDRAPTELESKKKLPRATIISFFEACNTQCGVPEFQERLARHVKEHNQPPNQLMIDMQRGMLEIHGFEKDHGCQMLSNIPKDFPEDKELLQRFGHWQRTAQQTCVSSLPAEMLQKSAAPNQCKHAQMQKEKMLQQISDTIAELSKGSGSVVKDARKQIEASSLEEKQAIVQGIQKKMQVFATLPNAGKARHMAGLGENDKLDLVKGLLAMESIMKLQKEASKTSEPPTGETPAMQSMPKPGKSQEKPVGDAPAPPQQQMM